MTIALRVAALLITLAVARCAIFKTPTPVPGVSARLTPDAAASAFRQGIEAAVLGQPISTCPFAGDDAARAWKAGWKWWGGG